MHAYLTTHTHARTHTRTYTRLTRWRCGSGARIPHDTHTHARTHTRTHTHTRAHPTVVRFGCMPVMTGSGPYVKLCPVGTSGTSSTWSGNVMLMGSVRFTPAPTSDRVMHTIRVASL